MGGFFGIAKRNECVNELFYGVDYNSHMGTKRAGIATCHDGVFTRSIHNIENSYFRTKFEKDLADFSGKVGIGVISDTSRARELSVFFRLSSTNSLVIPSKTPEGMALPYVHAGSTSYPLPDDCQAPLKLI